MSTDRLTGPAPSSALLLNNARTAAQVDELGYAQVPLLDPTDVTELLAAYRTTVLPDDSGLVVGYMRQDREQVRSMTDAMLPVWERRLGSILHDHRVAMTTFVVKHPGEDSLMFLHDDRTFVDEDVHRALTLWVPLVDVGSEVDNGGLQLIPRSHRLPVGWTGTNTPDHIRPFEEDLHRCLQPVTAAAGSAVVYDTRLLHASGPNRTDDVRVAAVCAVAPRGAPLIHVVATGRRHRQVHSVDATFFLDHHPRELEVSMPADFPVVASFEDDVELTGEDLAAWFGLDSTPQRKVVVPDDLRTLAPADAAGLPSRPSELPTVQHDVDLRAGQLGPAHQGQLLSVDVVAGSAGAALLRRGPRQYSTAPVGIDVQGLVSLLPGDTDLLVLDPGTRVRAVAAEQSGGRIELHVIESPILGAGMFGATGACELRLGDAVTVPGEGRVTLWNQGPGPVVAVVHRRHLDHPEPGSPRARSWRRRVRRRLDTLRR